MPGVVVNARVQRSQHSKPRFVVIPREALASLGAERPVALVGTLNGVPVVRLRLAHLDDAHWLVELPGVSCREARVDVGSVVELRLSVAPGGLPEELKLLIETSDWARAAWRLLTPDKRHLLSEHIASAKQPATRARRARRALLSR